MKFKILCMVFLYLKCIEANTSNGDFLIGQKQVFYNTAELSEREFSTLSQLSNVNNLQNAIKKILIPRVVGTPGHAKVREYIIKTLKDLQWSTQLDSFNDTARVKGILEFHNIIATLNPNAERYFVLGCHYDSKYVPNIEFLGATDSAVPCAMLLNLAEVLNDHLEPFRKTELSLMLLFFDGEEAFEEWGPTDSIYGARHLAKKWESENFLPKIDILMLLDLLGAHSPEFYSYFKNTVSWYVRLLNIESRLADTGLMQQYVSSGMLPQKPKRYFQPNAYPSFVEDDHTPFLKRNVPILHIIPQQFPAVWHTIDDNENVIDINTTENLALIIRLFTMEYLLGILNK